MNAQVSPNNPRRSFRLQDLTLEQRITLEERLAARRGGNTGNAIAPIPRAPTPAPLSVMQERLWFLDKVTPGGYAYNIPMAFSLRGELDAVALTAAYAVVLERHDILRTNFVAPDGRPEQLVHPGVREPLQVTALEGPPRQAAARALQLANELLRTPFDLGQDQLVRARLFQITPRESLFAVSASHTVFDGWSEQLFVDELAAAYQAIVNDQAPSLPPLTAQYADFASWHREWSAASSQESQLEYWTTRLSGAPSVLNLPFAKSRPPQQTENGAIAVRHLAPDLVTALESVGQRVRASLYMVMLGALDVILARYAGAEEVLIGMPVAGRQHHDTRHLIGFFSNVLVTRGDLRGDPSFVQFLTRVRRDVLDALAHPDIPFERLVGALNVERDRSRAPIIQTMLIDHQPAALKLPGVDATAEPLELGAPLDLTFLMSRQARGLRFITAYNTDVFDRDEVERFLDHFESLLTAIAGAPQTQVSELPLFGRATREQLITGWNNTRVPYPASETVPSVFAARCAASPQAIAVQDGTSTWSYTDLKNKTATVARALHDEGIGEGDIVALFVERSISMVAAILGAQCAGATYVPIDPNYPAQRIEYMLDDSCAALVLASESALVRLPTHTTKHLVLDAVLDSSRESTELPVTDALSPDAPAYLIYTSGSTGAPKGVVGSHGAILNRLHWMWDAYPFTDSEVCCQKTTLSFVDSVAEILSPILAGVPLVIIDSETQRNPRALLAALRDYAVTRIVLVPSLLRALLDAAPQLEDTVPSLTTWVTSGETLPSELASDFYAAHPNATLINLYGSSEVAADCTYHVVERQFDSHRVPIGKPIANTALYVVDESDALVPPGVPGQLLVGGAGLANEYWRRPELTEERFVGLSHTDGVAPRVFRTGDIVRHRTDGALEFLGRADSQVKLRGIRIELGELETVLREHDAVEDCVASTHASTGGEETLVAYIVVASDCTVQASQLREHLRTRLPDFLCPGPIVELDALPRLPNGKTDRSALPPPDEFRAPADDTKRPKNHWEVELTNIWETLLGFDNIGLNENFFDLGGHSLLAVRMFAELEARVGEPLPLALVFEAPTIAELAARLSDTQWKARWSCLVPLQPTGDKAPLYLVHPIGANILHYSDVARRLSGDRPVVGVQPVGLDGSTDPLTSIEAMADQYIQEIEHERPDGPYVVGGSSFGGVVAFEMARRWRERGQDDVLVVLFDSYAPDFVSMPEDLTRWERWSRRQLDRVTAHWINVTARDWRARGAYLGTALRTLKERATKSGGAQPAEQVLAGTRAVIQANNRAIRQYKPSTTYSGPLLILRARGRRAGVSRRRDLGWEKWCDGEITIADISGYHGECCREPHAASLIEQFADHVTW